MKLSTIILVTTLFAFIFLISCTKDNALIDNPITIENPTNVDTPTVKGNYSNEAFDAFGVKMQKEMQNQHIPALSVLVFEADEVVYEGCFGKSNIQQNIKLEKDHPFLLASVSKVVTATALLQLYDRGLFDLDDSINDYLSFEVAIPNSTKDVTFRMLLTHTSGIADGTALDDQYYYGEDSPVELGDFLEDYLSPDGAYYDKRDNFYDFEPGSDHEYSNIGAALIGLLVEEIADMDFSEYCKKHIFNPLGMRHTSWKLAEIDQTIVQPYDYVNGRYEEVEHYTFTDYPNGGLRSTAHDLFQFMSAYAQEGKANNYQLLKATTIGMMTTLQIPNLSDDMGLHLFQMDKAANLWGHDGGEQGVATIMAFNPTTQIGAIILTNQGEANLDDLLLDAYELGGE